MRKTTQLRTLINAKEILALPGIYDALSARIAERAGHKAITIGGYAMTGSLLGELICGCRPPQRHGRRRASSPLL